MMTFSNDHLALHYLHGYCIYKEFKSLCSRENRNLHNTKPLVTHANQCLNFKICNITAEAEGECMAM